MQRRSFLQIVAGGVAGSLLQAGKAVSAFPAGNEAEAFALVRGADTAKAVETAVSMVGGMGSFVSKGDVVFVKPNISWDRVPEQAATTNPIVVDTVIKLVLDAGAKKVVIADNTCNDKRRCYVRSKIKEIAEANGAEAPFMEDRKFVKTNLGGEVITDWEVYRGVLEADKIINLPIAKHHGLSGVTLSMKNLMGLIGGKRNRLHLNLPESIVDLTAFFKPALTILDGVRVLVDHGPQGGSMKDVVRRDTIAASVDPVKIDAFGVTLFGDRFQGDLLENFPHLGIAQDRGLGTIEYRGSGFNETDIG